MTNETAINHVNTLHESGKIESIARVFLCEDILERGIDDWLSSTADENLQEILELAYEKSYDFVEGMIENYNADEAFKLHQVRSRMLALLVLVSDYMLTREFLSRLKQS